MSRSRRSPGPRPAPRALEAKRRESAARSNGSDERSLPVLLMPWSWTQTLPRSARAGEGERRMGRFRRKTAAGDRADRWEQRKAGREKEGRAIHACPEREGGLG